MISCIETVNTRGLAAAINIEMATKRQQYRTATKDKKEEEGKREAARFAPRKQGADLV